MNVINPTLSGSIIRSHCEPVALPPAIEFVRYADKLSLPQISSRHLHRLVNSQESQHRRRDVF